MNNSAQELHFEHLKGQTQFAYFQLGGGASAIAYALHETNGKSLDDTPWLLGVAVIMWASSFAIGCFGVKAHQHGLLSNVKYLHFNKEVQKYLANNDVDAIAVDKEAKEIAEDAVNKAGPLFRWQLWTLFAGAIAYIGGHVVEMAETPSRATHVLSKGRLAK